jgi:hypothetical protein
LIFKTTSVKEYEKLKTLWPVRLELLGVVSSNTFLLCGWRKLKFSHTFEPYGDLTGGYHLGVEDGEFDLGQSLTYFMEQERCS